MDYRQVGSGQNSNCLNDRIHKVGNPKTIFVKEWEEVLHKYKLSNTISTPASLDKNRKSKQVARQPTVKRPIATGTSGNSKTTKTESDTVDNGVSKIKTEPHFIQVKQEEIIGPRILNVEDYIAKKPNAKQKKSSIIQVQPESMESKPVVKQPTVKPPITSGTSGNSRVTKLEGVTLDKGASKIKTEPLIVQVKQEVIVKKPNAVPTKTSVITNAQPQLKEEELGKKSQAVLTDFWAVEAANTVCIEEVDHLIDEVKGLPDSSVLGKDDALKRLPDGTEIEHLTDTAKRLKRQQDQRSDELLRRKQLFPDELETKMKELGIGDPTNIDDSYLNLNTPLSIDEMIDVCTDGGHPPGQIENLEELKTIFRSNNVRPVFVMTKAPYICKAGVNVTPDERIEVKAHGDDPLDALQKALRDLDKRLAILD